MADVNGRPGDRAQMILVAAFGIAVMLVALALILNTAIYTENLATRGSDISGGKDAVQFRASTEQFGEETIQYVNYHNNTTADTQGTYTPLTEPVRLGVWNYSNMSGRHQAFDGVVTNITLEEQNEGTRIFRYSEGDFTGESGERNWTTVDNTRNVRNLTINVSNDSLASTDPEDNSPVHSSPVFTINLSDSDETHDDNILIQIFEDQDTDNLVVTKIYDSNGNEAGRCEAEYGGDDHVLVEVSEARVNGTVCPPLRKHQWATDEKFHVHFNDTEDGSGISTINGRYTMVVSKSFTGVTTVASGTPWPSKTRAIYSTTVRLVYESKRLYFASDVRAAPGEPDD
jgi:hypothetical protein